MIITAHLSFIFWQMYYLLRDWKSVIRCRSRISWNHKDNGSSTDKKI